MHIFRKNVCPDMDQILHYLTVLSFNDTISGERTGVIVPVSPKLYSVLSSIPAHKSTIPKSEKTLHYMHWLVASKSAMRRFNRRRRACPKKKRITLRLCHTGAAYDGAGLGPLLGHTASAGEKVSARRLGTKHSSQRMCRLKSAT